MKERRVVCAACRHDGYMIMLLSARHWDAGMHAQADQYGVSEDDRHEYEQGFIDQWGVFMDRQEAWKVAKAAGQVIYTVGGDSYLGGTLYSENLY